MASGDAPGVRWHALVTREIPGWFGRSSPVHRGLPRVGSALSSKENCDDGPTNLHQAHMSWPWHTRRQYVKMILSVILHNLFKVCLYTIVSVLTCRKSRKHEHFKSVTTYKCYNERKLQRTTLPKSQRLNNTNDYNICNIAYLLFFVYFGDCFAGC